jgi:crossover junction endodeoxyribonuclease RusA
LNSREHWAAKARTTQQVRFTASRLCEPLRRANKIEVVLTYFPKDSRRRDADNLVATLKPICDGIVDAGVVTDDDPSHMVKHMPVIAEPDSSDPRMELSITVLTPDYESDSVRGIPSMQSPKVTSQEVK